MKLAILVNEVQYETIELAVRENPSRDYAVVDDELMAIMDTGYKAQYFKGIPTVTHKPDGYDVIDISTAEDSISGMIRALYNNKIYQQRLARVQ